jgi:hypothetical protein
MAAFRFNLLYYTFKQNCFLVLGRCVSLVNMSSRIEDELEALGGHSCEYQNIKILGKIGRL